MVNKSETMSFIEILRSARSTNCDVSNVLANKRVCNIKNPKMYV